MPTMTGASGYASFEFINHGKIRYQVKDNQYSNFTLKHFSYLLLHLIVTVKIIWYMFQHYIKDSMPSFLFTMDGEKLGLVPVLTRSYMNGWIPFQDKIEQIPEMSLAPKQ